MDATLTFLPTDPYWQRQARPRLVAGMLVATILVAVALGTFRLPVVELLQPGPEIMIRLLPEIVAPLAEPPVEPVSEPTNDTAPAIAETVQEETAVATTAEPGASGDRRDPPDWHGQIQAAARAAADEAEHVAAVNPAMDEKRRRAAEQFYASLAPEKKEIWDNVETDQLGRKILKAGDCYRIIDDPSAANYEIWREFQQYFVYCSFGGSEPGMLPWAEAIRDRYLYLKYPDGEIPEDELRNYVER